ncbi:MAG: hypothetical protein R3183_03370 [Oleiphilaceae bacterium]|nr:hypothetical protein [Oleiphilaceae bacterium]
MEVNSNPLSIQPAIRQRLDRAAEERQAREQDTQDRSASRARSERTQIDSEALVQRGEAVQAQRALRVDNAGNFDLSTRNALQSYQQTQEASEPQEQGVLAGIDLYV